MNEITLLDYLRLIRKRWYWFLIWFVVAGVVGAAIGYSIPKDYRSGVDLVCETQTDDGPSGGAASLAKMAGFDIPGGSDAIGPSLYPTVVSSSDFIVDMLYVPVTTKKGKSYKNFITYTKEETIFPWWYTPKKWLLEMLKSFRSEPRVERKKGERIQPQHLTESEYELVEEMRRNLSCSTNDDGIISISFCCQDPAVAQAIVDTAKVHLQRFITKYRTTKVKNDLAYYQKISDEALAKYEAIRLKYANYCDTHQNSILAVATTEQESLENEMQQAYQAYSQLKQQVQTAEAKLQERTPAFTVLTKASVPAIPEHPKKPLICIVSVFIAMIGYAGWLYLCLLFRKPKEEKEDEDEDEE